MGVEAVVRRAKAAVRSRTPVSWVRVVQRTRGSIRDRQQRWFDRRHHVSTAGIVYPEQMDVDGPTATDGHLYEPTWQGSVRRMIRSLHLDLEPYTFVDVGSGKGPVLLYASEFGFRRIIGIEYDPELHAAAERNLASYRARKQRCHDITSMCADALDVPIPDGPLVLFLCNPFEGATLDRYLDNVAASLAASPRPVHVISFNPGIEAALDRRPWLTRTGGGWSHATYRADPARAPGAG